MSEFEVVLSDARSTKVADLDVQRALPTRGRRSVGAWCFVDHMGPASLSPDNSVDVAPHPHIGLQTVTWLFDGEIVHRDGLGTEQLIRPGQLNLMTSGRGIAHSEESSGVRTGGLHGVQLWVALPSSTREGSSAFEHHDTVPTFVLANGEGTLLVGAVGGEASPARCDSEIVGIDLRLRGGPSVVELRPDFEYALIVTQGVLEVGGTLIEPSHLAYLGQGHDELALTCEHDTVAMLLGGVPLKESIVMWWNFVARSQDEITSAYESWMKSDDRFAPVNSHLARIEVGPPPWFQSNR